MKNINWIKVGLYAFIFIMGAISIYFILPKSEPLSIDPIVNHYEQLIEKQSKLHKKKIDSLHLQYVMLDMLNAKLQNKITKLEKEKTQSVIDYRKLKVDQRAEVFLSCTQTTPTKTPVFYKDSLLVPMSNVDSAMTIIIDERYCDTVINVKDQQLDNYRAQVITLISSLSEYKALNELQVQKNSMMQLRLEQSDQYLKQAQRRIKWLKIKGTAKDVVIIGGLVLIFL